MAKGKGGPVTKVTFGKRRTGKAKKAFNRHDKRSRVYRGQGR